MFIKLIFKLRFPTFNIHKSLSNINIYIQIKGGFVFINLEIL